MKSKVSSSCAIASLRAAGTSKWIDFEIIMTKTRVWKKLLAIGKVAKCNRVWVACLKIQRICLFCHVHNEVPRKRFHAFASQFAELCRHVSCVIAAMSPLSTLPWFASRLYFRYYAIAGWQPSVIVCMALGRSKESSLCCRAGAQDRSTASNAALEKCTMGASEGDW